MDHNLSEREINLWDMLWAVCQSWRRICLGAVLAAVLAGGLSYFRSEQSLREAQALQNIRFEDLEEADRLNVEMYLDYYGIYNSQLEYNHESPLMQLDANSFYLESLGYYIYDQVQAGAYETDAGNRLGGVKQAYLLFLESDEFREQVQQEFGTEDKKRTAYIMEQIDTGGRFTHSSQMGDLGSVMTISICADNEETCEKLVGLVKTAIEQRKEAVTAKAGEHQVVLLQESCEYTINSDLLEYQKNNIDNLSKCKSSLEATERLLSEKAQSYIKQVNTPISMGNASEKDRGNEGQIPQAGVSKKMVLIGFLAGAFLVFGIEALLYLLNHKLLYEDDFEELYKVKLLGRIERNKTRRAIGFIDRIFLRLRRINQHHFEESKVIEMMYMEIKLIAQKRNITSIYVTGEGTAQGDEPVLNQVIDRLRREGVHIQIGNSILYDAQALEQSAKAGNVILLEKAGESSYLDIQKEIEICSGQDAFLLGAIVIE